MRSPRAKPSAPLRPIPCSIFTPCSRQSREQLVPMFSVVSRLDGICLCLCDVALPLVERVFLFERKIHGPQPGCIQWSLALPSLKAPPAPLCKAKMHPFTSKLASPLKSLSALFSLLPRTLSTRRHSAHYSPPSHSVSLASHYSAHSMCTNSLYIRLGPLLLLVRPAPRGPVHYSRLALL